ncbi:MAG: helix-turn-helix transcriptional regulator [Anaerolineales bacterium]|nr:helix-turn-helix transcriptional regulator [Anaerolineales bacterium]
MNTLAPANLHNMEDLLMGTVKSHVPALLTERGWGPMDLVRRANLSVRTAYRLTDGEAYFTTQTLEKLCQVFGVPVEKIIEFVPDEEQSG